MVSIHRHLSWEEVESGRWEREVDEAEQFYTSLARMLEGSGRMAFAITGHLSISCPTPTDSSDLGWSVDFDDALRKAWLTLRHDEPAIASWVEYSSRSNKLVKVYQSGDLDNNSLLESRWLNNTFQIVTGFENGEKWCNSDPPAPKLPTFFVVHPETNGQSSGAKQIRRDLIIRSPHDIMDGIGTLQLLDRVLQHTSAAIEGGSQYVLPRFGEEWKRLNPPLRLALGISSEPSNDIKQLYDEIIVYNTRLSHDCDVLVLPSKQSASVPGRHQRTAANLTAKETAQLLSACKTEGISVTHAYHAAAAITLTRIQNPGSVERTARYINYALINLRPECSSEHSQLPYAASVYHSVSPYSLAIDTTIPALNSLGEKVFSRQATQLEWDRVLDRVKSFYLAIRDDEKLVQLSPLIWANAVPPCDWNKQEAPPIPPPNKAPSVSISSMGVIDKIITPEYGRLQVHNPWVTGEELGNGLGLFLGTFRGELSLSAAFNEAWHDVDEIDCFLERCHLVVREGLGIGQQEF